jgi:hypothetical protein
MHVDVAVQLNDPTGAPTRKASRLSESPAKATGSSLGLRSRIHAVMQLDACEVAAAQTHIAAAYV